VIVGFEKTTSLDAFGLSVLVEKGALRRITFGGHEVVRLIDYPVRDANWGTLSMVTENQNASGKTLLRHFRTADGAIQGRFDASIAPAANGVRISADLVLTATRQTLVNRAGFIVLHPLAGVVGEPLCVRHADGRTENLCFPTQISPAQPVLDITGINHRVGDIEVSIVFGGEVFEMEDQRNWTDASFKTYCRPLALPRPYDLYAGAETRQSITVTLTRLATAARHVAPDRHGVASVMPEVLLAHEDAITGAPHPEIASTGARGVLLRADAGMGALPGLDLLPDCAITLELVTGQDAATDITAAHKAVTEAGLKVKRAVALTRDYLKSHQPAGPWPGGPAPMDMVAMVRHAFPGVRVGGGALSNFTEFNRCPPDPALVDFVTFGTTAIVHAADDLSVIETLEAIPQVIASTRALSGELPLHLGLMSIAMRSNPYGAGVVPNPHGERLPMAMADPRQYTPFAAAFAIALAAACVRGGVASFAPAMTGGPLGMAGEDGPWPLWHAVAALAALSGASVMVDGASASGLITIKGKGRRGIAGVSANLGPAHADIDGPAVLVPVGASADWIDGAGSGGPLTLAPMTAAILREVTA